MKTETKKIIESVNKYFLAIEICKKIPEVIKKNYSVEYPDLLVETFLVGRIEEWIQEGHNPGWIVYPENDEIYSYGDKVLKGQVEFVSPEDIAVKIEKGKLFIPDFKIGDIAIVFRDIHSLQRLKIAFLRQK